MATVVAVGRGPRLFLVEIPGGSLSKAEWDTDLARAAERRSDPAPRSLPEAFVDRLRACPPDARILAAGSTLAERVRRRTGTAVADAGPGDLRECRAALPALESSEERTFLRAVARVSLDRALRAPEEMLITLAREEERVERARGREDRAAEAFLVVSDSPLQRYRSEWDATRQTLAQHHARLLSALESEANAVLPNLSAVVGPRVAARLLSAAGSLAALGRMSAPRLQLLGTRRRPSPDHGPRYGVLYRAVRMLEVPPGRRGAFARSVAALAAIAARADATTRRNISAPLLARRDRRVEQLARRRG